MRSYLPDHIKKTVAERAGYNCEYCLVNQFDMFLIFQVDHIISIKHGGLNSIMNLAFSCPSCNRNKGTDLGTFLHDSTELIRFFNPRVDIWSEHFETENGAIYPRTRIAEATIKIFLFNDPERIILRQGLIEFGRYPARL